MRAWIFFAFLLAVQILSILLQSVVPFFPEYGNFRPLLYPLIFCYGALALTFGQTLILAFCTGLTWDFANAQFFQEMTDAGTMHRAVELSFGWPILAYAFLAIILHGLKPHFVKGHWGVYALACGGSTMLILLTEFIVITLARSGFEFPIALWPRIYFPGLINIVLAPLVYLGFQLVSLILGFSPDLTDEESSPKRRARTRSTPG